MAKEMPVEVKFKLLVERKRSQKGQKALAKEFGVSTAAVEKWVQKEKEMVAECLEYVKIADSGLLKWLLPEEEVKEDKSEKELKREIAFLRAKVSYYEALAEELGVDFKNASKKNAAQQSGRLEKEAEALS